MTDLNQLRRLAGVPVDLSKVENARSTVRVPSRLQKPVSTLTEAAKVPQHRGELAPKNKKNMRQRVSCAKKALEMLEIARDELMSLPAIDYMEDIPDVIRQLHQMLHGEDGTGGLHHLHRSFEREYNDMEFPEDLENSEPGMDGNPTKEELKAKEKEAAKKKKDNEKKAAVKEGVQAVDNVLTQAKAMVNGVPGAAEDMEGEDRNTADNPIEQEETSHECFTCDGKGQVYNKAKGKVTDCIVCKGRGFILPLDEEEEDNVKSEVRDAAQSQDIKDRNMENPFDPEQFEQEEDDIKPEARSAAQSRDVKDRNMKNPFNKAQFEQEELAAETKNVSEATASRVIFPKNQDWIKPGSDLDKKFAADADLNKDPAAHIATEEQPVNVMKGKQGGLFYPKTTHDEGPNQIQTNPYNESQKVHVPATIKSALKAEADAAQKNAEMFSSRKDLDSKNFYEDMAKALTELHMRLDEGTLYSMKQAQILMTSMMSIFTNKIPPDVVKFIAAGGTVRPLKDYFKQVQGNFDEWHIHPSK